MNSRPPAKPPIPCPHPNCPYSFPHLKGVQSQLRQHLATIHTKDQNDTLNPTTLHKLHCFPCSHCHTIFATVEKLQQHNQHHHPTTRTQTNSDIIFHSFPHSLAHIATSQTQQDWDKSLAWLTRLTITPPTSRHTIYHKLKPPHKKIVFACLHHIIHWCNQAMIPYQQQDHSVPEHQCTATPFFKLLFTFESIFLAPPTSPQQSYSHLLQQRYELLKTGKIEQLYTPTRQPPQHQPTTKPIPLFDDLQHNRSAQLAADQDNLHTAYQRVKSITPKVSLTPHNVTNLRTLYPPAIPYATDGHHTRSHTHTYPPPITADTKQMLKTLQKLKRGTAPGPFADSTDLLCDYATFTTHRSQTTYPHLAAFTQLLNYFITNTTPTTIQESFAAQYVIALHKDPHNLSKIRPIGIGTAFRRITAAAMLTLHGHALATFLIPHGQLAINVPGGLDFIVHSTQAQIQHYITTPQHPTRALLTLDITNMFNAISRRACCHTISQNPTLHALLPVFDLLYHTSNTCWYQTDTHSYDHFPQPEGFTQGCPLSGAFADIVLTNVLQPINQQLQTRISTRSPTELPPTTLSYHDDTSIVIPYPDITWFLDTFQQLGAPLGICLNLSKTQLLTSTTTQPPNLSPQDHQFLQTILLQLGPSIVYHNGLQLLGQPVGSTSYATTFLYEQVTHLRHNITTQLLHCIHDLQTQFAILKHCAIPSIVHLLATHLYHHFDSDMDTHTFHWNSTITLDIRLAIHHAIATITQQKSLPLHAAPIIHLPATLGGLGIRDPIAATIPSYITTITRSLRYAKHGIHIHNHTHPLSPLHEHVLTLDRHHRILTHYSTHFLPILPSNGNTIPPTLSQFIAHTSLPGLQRHFYHYHQRTIYQELLAHPPVVLQAALPSLLSPLTSLPLASMSRRIPTNRFSNDTFRILLQRKLRVPIFAPSIQHIHCTCRSHPKLDPYGDHLFSCTMASKTPIHNYMRDTMYHILTKLGPLAKLVRTPTDIQLEPPHLLPHLPTLRPADIGLYLLPDPKYHHNETTEPCAAIDITFTPVPSFPTPTPSLVPPVTNPLFQVHDDSAKRKFNVPHAPHLSHQKIILIPFTIDHFGGLGHFANRFLFGTHTISPPPPPPWTPDTFRANPEAYTLFQTSLQQTPSGIFPRATHHWTHGALDSTRFGTTYHTFTPTQWATQVMALNLSKALSHHLLTHLRRLTTHTANHRRPTTHDSITDTPPLYLPPLPVLLPGGTTLDLPPAAASLIPTTSPPSSQTNPPATM